MVMNGPCVPLEIATGERSERAFTTREDLFLCVSIVPVPVQGALSPERLLARLTDVFPLPGVYGRNVTVKVPSAHREHSKSFFKPR